MSLVKGESTTVLDVITNFVRVSIGGPLLGLLVGIIVSFWMKKIIRDAVLSVNITFIGTFICFYIA
jgi:NhaP-type Na+/H+ or K+/H+ antiporter